MQISHDSESHPLRNIMFRRIVSLSRHVRLVRPVSQAIRALSSNTGVFVCGVDWKRRSAQNISTLPNKADEHRKSSQCPIMRVPSFFIFVFVFVFVFVHIHQEMRVEVKCGEAAFPAR